MHGDPQDMSAQDMPERIQSCCSREQFHRRSHFYVPVYLFGREEGLQQERFTVQALSPEAVPNAIAIGLWPIFVSFVRQSLRE